jgi:hypothetical protein
LRSSLGSTCRAGEDKQKRFYDNARRILGLRDPVRAGIKEGVREPAPA